MRLLGPSALVSYERARLLEQLNAPRDGSPYIDAQFVHFVALSHALTETQSTTLAALLDYGERGNDLEFPAFVVVPRPGTLSPWSSKATDIARGCGLDAVTRIERGVAWSVSGLDEEAVQRLKASVHDRMTETVFDNLDVENQLFQSQSPRPLVIGQGESPRAAFLQLHDELGLGLEPAEIAYLGDAYERLGRSPTDAELMMFAQVNSEHCRHKIFNAAWTVDGQPHNQSLFDMIRNTHATHPGGVLSAYSDNSAVTRGWPAKGFVATAGNQGRYEAQDTEHHIAVKVETHNHPTAISPFPGAATGSGGEIRDEAATGRGARAKAGLTGYTVSNLNLEDVDNGWAEHHGRPGRIASALDIMLEAPLGAAGYNNEFGRPALGGYFRTFETTTRSEEESPTRWGYHKPIMIAGGLGNIRGANVDKHEVNDGMCVVVLGGPAMLIGLGGGAASSASSGTGDETLDFASVQRGNAEMQRRAQQVIDACWAMDENNPIVSIHDVGAGGLSNAVPEIVDADGQGAELQIRRIPSADSGLSPMELWCNESQERYVLAVHPEGMDMLKDLAARERCPIAVLGTASKNGVLELGDELLDGTPVNLPMSVLLGRLPRMQRTAKRVLSKGEALSLDDVDLTRAVHEVLRAPTVGDKSFLITIGDRTVGGLSARDQMVGPHQVPVADCAVTLTDYESFTGEAMAMGERPPIAVLDAPASGRMAVAESLTNIASAPIRDIGDIVLSANWMAACGHEGQDAALFDTVRSVGMDFCPALGVSIPVGKDSLSMKTVWSEDGEERSVVSPLSLVTTAFAPVYDARLACTPELDPTQTDSVLLFIDLGLGQQRLGGSILSLTHKQFGDSAPDAQSAPALKGFFSAIQSGIASEAFLAYHDRSDGGLVTTLSEMCFAGGCGIDVDLSALGASPIKTLFNEELGAVVQVPVSRLDDVLSSFGEVAELAGHVHQIGSLNSSGTLRVRIGDALVLDESVAALHESWSTTSYRMCQLRDNPTVADQAQHARVHTHEAALRPHLTFDPQEDQRAPAVLKNTPRAAILREQGVNGHNEMAAAFHFSGFESVDVHMTDIMSGRVDLADFQLLAACGGFSYGDVLGGGGGWAGSIAYNPRAREQFMDFFARPDTLTLGVCNGCQMLARLKDLIPGAQGWPLFTTNRSQRFEARLSMVRVEATKSAFFTGMEGSLIPVPLAHGEGFANFAANQTDPDLASVCLRYANANGDTASTYPANPNGSPDGITGVTSEDGRATILMPHPERAFRTVQLSWHPRTWGEKSPWSRMFANAQAWLADR